MTEKRDYYEILGVSNDVTERELKKSYRQLAMKYHPDQNPDDEQAVDKFKELTEAYQILSDPDSRAKYDRFGHQASSMGGAGGAGGVGFDMDMGGMTDFFESVFGSVFGGASTRRTQGQRGRDLQYDLSLTLEQVIAGAEVKISIPRPVRCDSCGGSGAKKGTQPKTCPHCGGRGQIRLQQGIFSMAAPCTACGGRGQVIAQPCLDCQRGLVTKEEDFEISVPAGVDDGSVKVMHGGGEHGRGGAPNGDLNIMIRVDKHPDFERLGNDLLSRKVITFPQAVFGDEIQVKTINGSVKMKVKQGTQSGRIYSLRGKGVPFLRGNGSGDQKVRVDVDIPKELNERQRELIEELGKEFGTEVQQGSVSFVDKVKSLFD